MADITYLPTLEGWLFLACVMDLYSRRIVGWSMRADLEAQLVCDAVAMAIARRRPQPGLVHHSDRGFQPEFNRSSQHCRFACVILGAVSEAGQRALG